MNQLITFKILFISLMLAGCVVTRSDLSDGQQAPGSRYNVPKTFNAPKPASTGQAKTTQELAALEYQLKSYEEQFRSMLGRIEELETKTGSMGKADSERIKDLEQAISEILVQQEQLKKDVKAAQDGLTAYQTQQSALQAQKLKEAEEAAKAVPTGNLESADKLFAEAKWDKAAQEFQEFRKKNPKSNEVPIVTYKIGVCFQELGLKSEAKTFFNNVVQAYPNSKASKFAKIRLESLK